jgi:hypothetical protein
MPKKEYISNKLTLSAVFVIALIVFVIPLGFYLSSYRYMEGELNAEAIYIADNVNEIIGRNPVMWQYEQMRLLDAISKSQAAYADLHVRVLRMDETMVVEMDSYVRKPFMRKQIAIYDAGVPVGTTAWQYLCHRFYQFCDRMAVFLYNQNPFFEIIACDREGADGKRDGIKKSGGRSSLGHYRSQ